MVVLPVMPCTTLKAQSHQDLDHRDRKYNYCESPPLSFCCDDDGTPPDWGVVRFFSFFAHRTTVPLATKSSSQKALGDLQPQALHNVLGPLGPFLHSGESNVPQSVHTYSSATFSFFFLSPARPSLSADMAIPTSPLISVGL